MTHRDLGQVRARDPDTLGRRHDLGNAGRHRLLVVVHDLAVEHDHGARLLLTDLDARGQHIAQVDRPVEARITGEGALELRGLAELDLVVDAVLDEFGGHGTTSCG